MLPSVSNAVYMLDPGAIAAHADEIASLKLKATKTGVTFSVSKPISDELVEKLAISSRSKRDFSDCLRQTKAEMLSLRVVRCP